MNNVQIMGRLVADPEDIKLKNGEVKGCKLTVAVTRPVQKDHEKEVDYINVVAWNVVGDFISKFFKKGQMIALIGSLRINKYQTKEGERRSEPVILAEKAFFTGDGYTNAKKSDFRDKGEEDGYPLI